MAARAGLPQVSVRGAHGPVVYKGFGAVAARFEMAAE
jgi:hypothetical protein